MKTTIRIPQAPDEPLPELTAFLEPFHVQEPLGVRPI